MEEISKLNKPTFRMALTRKFACLKKRTKEPSLLTKSCVLLSYGAECFIMLQVLATHVFNIVEPFHHCLLLFTK